jgi:hypothetical protein
LLNHIQCFFDGVMGVAGRSKSLKCTLGSLSVASPDFPPGRLRCEKASNKERNWPHPLNCERDFISPFICSLERGSKDTRSDELTHHPA